MPRKPDKVKTRRVGSTVPPEVALALRFGKLAYRMHPTWESDEPAQECLDAFLLCGRIINQKGFAEQLWERFRDVLLKKPGIQSWWAYQEYEKRSKAKHI
jgi:hypothetical protein